MQLSAHPILTASEAQAFKAELLKNFKHTHPIEAIIGAALGTAILADFNTLRAFPRDPRILAVIGEDSDAASILYAAQALLHARPRGTVNIVQLSASPDTAVALQTILAELRLLPAVKFTSLSLLDTTAADIYKAFNNIQDLHACDICLESLSDTVKSYDQSTSVVESCIQILNTHLALIFKASLGKPLGIDEFYLNQNSAFRANVTYMPGIPDAELLSGKYLEMTGRLRYLDIGYFKAVKETDFPKASKLLLDTSLDPLRELRRANVDKHTFGHLFIVGGSTDYPGALLMAATAAIHSGVGMVTVCGPEQLFPHFFSSIPEVIHLPLPSSPKGTLAPSAYAHLQGCLQRTTAVLIGNGLTLDPDAQALVTKLVSTICLPILLDADALTPSILKAIAQRPENWPPVCLTPHAGEWLRLDPDNIKNPSTEQLKAFCKQYQVTTLLKGPITRIASADTACISTFGGPVLARAGSGDLLAGIAGGLIAQSPTAPLLDTLCQAVVWHGKAADRLAMNKGEVAVGATRLLPYLSEILRERF